jgi:LacI family transcriptional regulator
MRDLLFIRPAFVKPRRWERMLRSSQADATNDWGSKKNYYNITIKPTHVNSRTSTDIYSTNDNHIVTALKHIHSNLDKNIKVDHILKEAPLSRRSLEKRFIQIMGYPLYKSIYNLRIEKFAERLIETNMTIIETAQELGLNDTKNVARQFIQIKGLTPSDYRKKCCISNKRNWWSDY